MKCVNGDDAGMQNYMTDEDKERQRGNVLLQVLLASLQQFPDVPQFHADDTVRFSLLVPLSF